MQPHRHTSTFDPQLNQWIYKDTMVSGQGINPGINHCVLAELCPNPRKELLTLAEKLVNGDRNVTYGDPVEDFRRTATMWSAYLGTEVEPHDVAALMALLKLSRIKWSPAKQDHWADLAGYAACGWDVVTHTKDAV